MGEFVLGKNGKRSQLGSVQGEVSSTTRQTEPIRAGSGLEVIKEALKPFDDVKHQHEELKEEERKREQELKKKKREFEKQKNRSRGRGFSGPDIDL
ncbi:MAG: hypothetical protein SGI74_00350 [Oligoflexia bacterium]|nr:hypothetical protein [Oligoflexia bacterium]